MQGSRIFIFFLAGRSNTESFHPLIRSTHCSPTYFQIIKFAAPQRKRQFSRRTESLSLRKDSLSQMTQALKTGSSTCEANQAKGKRIKKDSNCNQHEEKLPVEENFLMNKFPVKNFHKLPTSCVFLKQVNIIPKTRLVTSIINRVLHRSLTAIARELNPCRMRVMGKTINC